MVENNQDIGLKDKKLINLDSITVKRNLISDNELSNKKYIDDELDKNTILRLNQTLQNYLKISVGNGTYNITKYDKMQLIDTTDIRSGKTGYSVLPNRKIICDDENNNGKTTNIVKTTRSSENNESIRSYFNTTNR